MSNAFQHAIGRRDIVFVQQYLKDNPLVLYNETTTNNNQSSIDILLDTCRQNTTDVTDVWVLVTLLDNNAKQHHRDNLQRNELLKAYTKGLWCFIHILQKHGFQVPATLEPHQHQFGRMVTSLGLKHLQKMCSDMYTTRSSNDSMVLSLLHLYNPECREVLNAACILTTLQFSNMGHRH